MSTVVWGAIPVVLLAGLVTIDHIPGTDISLTVPYAAQGPGPTFNTLGDVDGTPVVEIEGADTDETSGNLNMTTVSVRTNMTLAQALGRWLLTDDTLIPIDQVLPPDRSEEEIQESNQQAFVSSEAAATVAAMNYLDKPTVVVVHEVVDNAPSEGKVEAKDVLVALDGKEVSQPGTVQELVQAKKPGEEVELTLRRGDEEVTETVTLGSHPDDEKLALLGITMTSEPADDISVAYNLNDVGGPSAGMIFSLAVIDKLSPGELNGGRFVAGTGTISEDGTVGPIGGISHKVAAAEEEGAELFLAPSANCAEALSADTGEMVVARVDTLDDAIEAMDAFSAGKEVRTCAK
ncbi:PDZ domain-containing protein [Corynebacterium breve]|uniref:PDZ domain-containing protein n=1 Tax=Corynebacterium breve TaxID=3049799 RepID=A0ABY8VFA3_9CORY|nr:PDZ domain-containing protein [Corynebacterium breve]WIM68310.1 PDZ domain-containing protein [Corynebacterium breve]